MSSRSLDSNLQEQAAEWAIRLDAGTYSAEDMRRLDAWLSSDPEHGEALETARALWLELDVPALEAVRRTRARVRDSVSHRSRWLIGLAATLLLSVTTALLAGGEWLVSLRADEQTAVGESRWLTLDDRSRIQLNSDSAIALNYSREERGITLLKGEAAFEVAHDASRPFRVTAADGTTTALGTVFQVRIGGDAASRTTQVVVTQGRVQVGNGITSEQIAAGEQIVYSGESLGEKSAVDIDSASAWRRGRLSFVDQPLAVVVAELDRYYPGRIQLANAALATRSVSGVFATARPLDAVAAIERNLGVVARRSGDTIVIK